MMAKGALPISSPPALVTLPDIDQNPFQTRFAYNKEAIAALAADIRHKRQTMPDTLGLLQIPLGRRMPDGRVQLAFGHRRYFAFAWLEKEHGSAWRKMPVNLRELTDQEMADIAWSENGRRRDTTPIESVRRC